MKKFISLALVLCLCFFLTACGSSTETVSSDDNSNVVKLSDSIKSENSENTANESDVKNTDQLNSKEITEELPYKTDLDNSGSNATIELISDSSDSSYVLQISGDDVVYAFTDICSNCKVWLKDIDNDFIYDFILSGQTLDENYKTYFFKYGANGFESFTVSGVSEEESDGVSYNGWIYSISDDDITLATNIEVLGSYIGIKQFNYNNENIEPVLGSSWDIVDNNNWLTLKQELPVTKSDGNNGKLQEGSKILILSTNNTSWASYKAEDESTGIIHLAKDESGNWSIKSINESDYFESIPYSS